MTAGLCDTVVSTSRCTILTSAEASLEKGEAGSEDDTESERERLTPMLQFDLCQNYAAMKELNSTLVRSAPSLTVRLSLKLQAASPVEMCCHSRVEIAE